MASLDPVDGLDVATARRRLWLAALHQLAIADGDFSAAEQELLLQELARELPGVSLDELHHPGTEALVHRFGVGTPEAEEFLRTAVVVALADGHVSPSELEWLQRWSEALQVGHEPITALLRASSGPGGTDDGSQDGALGVHGDLDLQGNAEPHPDLLDGLRHWLDGIDPSDPAVARFLVRLIPAQCPFERDVTLFGWKIVHIPPMCKLNPLYDQLVGLRFRSLCRLEEQGAHPTAAG